MALPVDAGFERVEANYEQAARALAKIWATTFRTASDQLKHEAVLVPRDRDVIARQIADRLIDYMVETWDDDAPSPEP